MSSPLLSFVIPAYNVEPYLGRALDSILSQRDGVDYEIIVVDDCSTDGTHAVAESYAMRHPECIRVLRQSQNGGVSLARNAGKDVARGVYLWFVDADDVILPGAMLYLARVLKAAGKTLPDLISFNIVRYEKDTDADFVQAIEELSQAEPRVHVRELDDRCVFCEVFEHYGASILGANSICRRDICTEVGFRPYPNGEDMLWGVTILLRARLFVAVPARIYGYFQRAGSAVRTWNMSHFKSILSINLECYELAMADPRADAVRRIVKRRARSFLGVSHRLSRKFGFGGVDLWYEYARRIISVKTLFGPVQTMVMKGVLRLRMKPLSWLVFQFPFEIRKCLLKISCVAQINRAVNDWRCRR